jgi:hypothetical protein
MAAPRVRIPWQAGLAAPAVLVLLALSLAAPLVRAHDAAQLRTPEGGSARGEARIGDDDIRIRGDGLAAGDVAVLIAGADGALAEVARLDQDGDFDVRFESSFPLGAASAADFRGRAVAVVGEDGSTLLEGKFPGAPAVGEAGVGISALTSPEGSAFPDASGRVRVRAREGRHSLDVRVRGLSDGAVFTVCVADAFGNVETLGELTTSGGGNGALEVDTGEGGMLPFGASGVAELAGLAVRVKDADGDVVLAGVVPALGEVPPAASTGEVEVEFSLSPPERSPEPGIRGDVKLETESQRNDVRVRLEDATPGAEYNATIRRPDDEESRETLAELTADAEGEAEFEARGVALPLGASSIEELAGTIVEVFNAEGVLVLSGVTPQAPGAPPQAPPPAPRLEFEVALVQPETPVDPDAHGKVELEEEDDEHEIEVEVQDLVAGAAYRVELRDFAGAAEALFDGAADGEGDIRRRTVFLGAERLPFAVASFTAFEGFRIAVLDADGATVLAGVVDVPGVPAAGGETGGEGDGGGAGGRALEPFSFEMVGAYDAPHLRGDSNRDFEVDVSDPIATLTFLFRAGEAPECKDAVDSNDDGRIDISDPIHTLVYLFANGAPPAYPGPSLRGFDRTADEQFCDDE